MTAIQDWAAGLCTAGIGCSLLHLLCPAGAMRRVFGVLTAVFFFCCLLSPLSSAVTLASDLFVFPDEATVSRELSDTVNEQAQRVIEAALLRDATDRVGETVQVREVAIIRDMSRSDGIYIERIRVTLSEQDRPVPSAVYATLEQAWGRMVEVYYAD